ncbi:MAG: hypothetical protein JST54_18740 [Deltaproteobacteria bacterium]|nr:hypothetical protein [Deltaproteobacteria bacterium]
MAADASSREAVRNAVGAAIVLAAVTAGFLGYNLHVNRLGLDFEERLRAAADAAREREPDAELSSAHVSYVASTGHVELPISSTLHDPDRPLDVPDDGISFRFRSPSHDAAGAQASAASLGRPNQPNPQADCVIEVETRPSGARWATGGFRVRSRANPSSCGRSLPTPPRCTLAQVWARAIAQGAPAAALADLDLSTRTDGTRAWSFTITDWSKGSIARIQPVFSMTTPDDCTGSK